MMGCKFYNGTILLLNKKKTMLIPSIGIVSIIIILIFLIAVGAKGKSNQKNIEKKRKTIG
jgi:hypothetical protein